MTAGMDPDDVYSSISYEKGAQFLLHLERTVGGVDSFLRTSSLSLACFSLVGLIPYIPRSYARYLSTAYVKAYVARFAGLAITTDDWLAHFWSHWKKYGTKEQIQKLNEVKWDEWLYGEGLELPVKVRFLLPSFGRVKDSS